MVALPSADKHMEDVEDYAPAVGFAGVDMMLLLPKIMSYLRRDDLFRLMLVNKDFHHQSMYMLYRELWWDINDATGNHMIIRLMYATTCHHFNILDLKSLNVALQSQWISRWNHLHQATDSVRPHSPCAYYITTQPL